MNNPMRKRRLRFSVATLLLVTTVCAVSLTIWRIAIYEPPTHKIPLYEKAPGTRGRSIVVGPNTVRIRFLARNDRDGSIHLENGRGSSIPKRAVKNQQALIDAAVWLDVAQLGFEPTPDRIDIIEARIFDHESRSLISNIDPAFGWRIVEPDIIQIYGLGKKLPEKLDIWLRLHSYDAADPAATLSKTPQSTTRLSNSGCKLTLEDVREGIWGYSGGILSHVLDGREGDTISTVFTFDSGSWTGIKFQVAAVSVRGEKVHADGAPAYFDTRAPSSITKHPVQFDIALDDLSHFEVRPYGGRHRFFFDSVSLPKINTKPFTPPPKVKVAVNGAEINARIPELAPLDVRIATHQGFWANGTISAPNRAAILRSDHPTDQDKAFTIAYTSKGTGLPLAFGFLQSSATNIVPAANMPTGMSGRATGGVVSAGYQSYRTPLEIIELIEITPQSR